MPLEPHTAMGMPSPSSATILVGLIFVSFSYLRGWRGVCKASSSAIPAWRATSFLFGMSLIWGALGSPPCCLRPRLADGAHDPAPAC